MIKISALPVMLRIISKIDAKPIIEKLKGLDIFEAGATKMTKEQMMILGTEVVSDILPQLAKFEDDIVPLIAAIKEISVEEAQKLSAAEAINELVYDGELVSFFKSAFLKKVRPEA